MRKHRIMVWVVCLLMAFSLTDAAAAASGEPISPSDHGANAQTNDPNEIIDTVIENFTLLAQIPRPSRHEKKISDFFVAWANKQGLEPVQDDVFNVMFDVPASEGMEDYPLTILQGHMDMVVAVEDDKDFDPLTDPITVFRDDTANTLTADGTSLGSDDGIGCAIMMAAVQNKMPHGPLRIIITTGEEVGMEGAFNVDASWLEGASYFINIDSECSTEVTVSSAAGYFVHAFREISFTDPVGDQALRIELGGLLGGHSGLEIDKGRMNGVIGLAGLLKELAAGGIGYELADFDGGTSGNVIPAKACCTVVVSARDVDAVKEMAQAYADGLWETFAGIEDGITLTVTESENLPQVISEEDRDNAIRFLTEVIDGVYTWSADIEGLVESSSNLGHFSVDEGGLNVYTFIRSSVAAMEWEILDLQLALAADCGYETEDAKIVDPWPYDPDSRLLALTKEAYLAQNKEEIIVSAIHAGLECGTFKLLKPDLDMISIGPDISGAHTVQETLYLNSIPTVWNLLSALLIQLGA